MSTKAPLWTWQPGPSAPSERFFPAAPCDGCRQILPHWDLSFLHDEETGEFEFSCEGCKDYVARQFNERRKRRLRAREKYPDLKMSDALVKLAVDELQEPNEKMED